MIDATITSLAPWFGAKRRMRATIVAELGEHRAYWEPFCGSMATLLGKPRCQQETVNDLHGDITNLAWVLQDSAMGSRLYRRLRRVLASEAELDRAMNKLAAMPDPGDGPDEDRAYWFFIRSWLERSGFAGSVGGGRGIAVRYTPGGGSASRRWVSAVASIPAFRRRLDGVLVLRRNAFGLLEDLAPAGPGKRKADLEGVAIYLDPPYIEKGARYEHDFDQGGEAGGDLFASPREPRTHERLAALANRFEWARVVVSYYDHPKLAEWYPPDRWTKVDCSMSKSTSNAIDGGSETAPEVLLINGPSYTRSRA